MNSEKNTNLKSKNKAKMNIHKTGKTRMDYFVYFVIAAAVIQLLLLTYMLSQFFI